MNISRIRLALRKGRQGTFRPLKAGEVIDIGDVVVHDCFYTDVSVDQVGRAADDKDCIIRLEFEKEKK